MELTLKLNCRLPVNLRAKWCKVTFQFPHKVQKINFTNLNQEVKKFRLKDFANLEQLNKVVASYITTSPEVKAAASENGTADCDMKKRKVVWSLTNVKGGMNKQLDVCLSYEKDVLIDELQFK